MQWYLWALIALAAIFLGLGKIYLFRKMKKKKNLKTNNNKDED